MTEKRQEFLQSIKYEQDTRYLEDLPDRGNVFWAARIESERLAREELEDKRLAELPDRGNVFLAKKVEAEYQRRKRQEAGKELSL